VLSSVLLCVSLIGLLATAPMAMKPKHYYCLPHFKLIHVIFVILESLQLSLPLTWVVEPLHPGFGLDKQLIDFSPKTKITAADQAQYVKSSNIEPSPK
jgi:hypothetical protein